MIIFIKLSVNFININEIDENQRLDNFLFNKYKFLPKSKIYSLIRKKKIKINNKKVKYFYKLKNKDIIKIPSIYYPKNKKIKLSLNNNINYDKKKIYSLNILFQDNYLLAIDKKSGISVHGGTNIIRGLIEKIKFIFFKKNSYIELIHRLDKNASGILLLAKSKQCLRLFHNLFLNNKIYKEYIVLVHGIWPKSKKNINNLDFNKNICPLYLKKYLNIKDSITIVEKIFHFNKFSLLKLIPITGKKHQLRIHTAICGYPIVLDNIYGNFNLNNKFKIKYKISRLFLHCNKIKFIHPIKKINIEINSSLPKILFRCLIQINNNGST